MTVSLTKPAEGAVGWAPAINQNFTDIENAINVGHLPRGYIEGLQPSYNDPNSILVQPGSCRSDSDDDLVVSAQVTLSLATIAAFNSTHGLDETSTTSTATTHGTATFEPSSSLYGDAAMTRVVRTGTGTFTSTGTAVTGVSFSTLFAREVKAGDVIRSASNGAARVASVGGDTNITLVAAFPGGDVGGGGQAFTIYENLTIWPDTAQSGDKRKVNTITHAGTSVVVDSALTSNGSGRPMKVGVEVSSCSFFVHAVTNGTNTILVFSTQRTTPYLASVTGKRCIFSVRNGIGGQIDLFSRHGLLTYEPFHIYRTLLQLLNLTSDGITVDPDVDPSQVGDMWYRGNASEIARLARPSTDSVLSNPGSNAPAWREQKRLKVFSLGTIAGGPTGTGSLGFTPTFAIAVGQKSGINWSIGYAVGSSGSGGDATKANCCNFAGGLGDHHGFILARSGGERWYCSQFTSSGINISRASGSVDIDNVYVVAFE